MEKNITIATCLYTNSNLDNEDYIKLIQNVLKIRLPMVIYHDNNSMIEKIIKTREEFGLKDLTKTIFLPIEETYFYTDINVLTECMDEFNVINTNRNLANPENVIYLNSKFDFMERTIFSNPFGSGFFLWISIHTEECVNFLRYEDYDPTTEEQWECIWKEWPDIICKDYEHIHQLQIQNVEKPSSMPWKEYFQMIYNHVSVNLFGGHGSIVKEYIDLYKQQWKRMLYEERWWQFPEAIATIVAETYPEKIRFYYGYYDGIISNFVESKRCLKLLLRLIQRHFNKRRYEYSDKLIKTIDPTIDWTTDFVYYKRRYLEFRVINDFYRLEGKLSNYVIDLFLNDKFLQEIPHDWIIENISNLKYFNDPNVMSILTKWSFYNHVNKDPLQQWKDFFTGCNGESWVAIGDTPLSSFALLQNNLAIYDISLKNNEDQLPKHILKYFRLRFNGNMTDDIINLYKALETSGRPLIFFHTTATFLKEDKHDDNDYDKSLADLCKYFVRNYPKLKFRIVSLYTNRKWSISTCAQILNFYIETPNQFNLSIYDNCICHWLKQLLLQSK